MSQRKVKLSDWIVIDGYCATRIIEGTDENLVENRMAFIEKTPSVRLSPFKEDDDFENWEQGDKGSGGAYTDNHEKLGQYGFDTESRAWCDNRLKELGYELHNN